MQLVQASQSWVKLLNSLVGVQRTRTLDSAASDALTPCSQRFMDELLRRLGGAEGPAEYVMKPIRLEETRMSGLDDHLRVELQTRLAECRLEMHPRKPKSSTVRTR